MTLTSNVVVGQTVFQGAWDQVNLWDNTFYGEVSGIDPAAHPDNQYLDAAPRESVAYVRSNAYEPGRANVIVYNWALADAVEVNLNMVVALGATYEVRSALDFTGPPVHSGVFDGEPVALPMTGLTVAQPIGYDGAITPAEVAAPAFNVFVVTSACG